MIKLSKKKLAGVILGLVVIGSGVAYAYWTAGGTGSGTVTSGDVQPVTVVQTAATGVAPGVPKTLSGTFTNPNQGPVYVTDLTATIDSVTKAGGAPAGTCDATDYTLSTDTVTIGSEVLADDSSTWTGIVLEFVNKSSNQDACKGATVTIDYVAQ